MASSVIDGDVRIRGTLRADSFAPPANSIGNTEFDAADPLAATKQVHQYVQVYRQDHGAVAADKTSGIHVSHAAGTIIAFYATLKTANIGDSTVTVDLKKNGSTVLSAVASLDSGDAAYAVASGTINTAAYAADSVFEAVVDATAGTGTLGQGLTVTLVVREDAD